MKDDDFKMLGVLITDGQTDRRTDEQTFVNVESLSRLKKRARFLSGLKMCSLSNISGLVEYFVYA